MKPKHNNRNRRRERGRKGRRAEQRPPQAGLTAFGYVMRSESGLDGFSSLDTLLARVAVSSSPLISCLPWLLFSFQLPIPVFSSRSESRPHIHCHGFLPPDNLPTSTLPLRKLPSCYLPLYFSSIKAHRSLWIASTECFMLPKAWAWAWEVPLLVV